ncbi:MATA-HMG [Gigaspora margarita]|uniref:MATA-HMG n=1 Tax=Gigaspora margarita TaxID=4874 RepID=A0A8H4EV53_GIGMA|nr:MATA-HMG [Gigaspora margarita]
MNDLKKIQESQLSLEISSGMRIPKSCCENSLNNGLFRSVPYKLTLGVEELISPPQNSRKAKKYLKNPQSSPPPRPQNKFVLFRRDFSAKQKRIGKILSFKNMSQEASNAWDKLSNEEVLYFEALEKLAKDRHNEIYPDYKYLPNKNDEKKSKSKNVCQKNTKYDQSFVIINYEQTLEEPETTFETSPTESNVSELSFSEPPNSGLLNSNDWYLFDQSTGILPLDFPTFHQENFNEYEYYDQSTGILPLDFPTFHQENFNEYEYYDQSTGILPLDFPTFHQENFNEYEYYDQSTSFMF